MSIRKNFVMLSLLCVLAFFSLQLDSARAASCPHCGQYYPPAAPGDWARVEALRRDHERSCSRGGDPDPVRSISAVNIHNQTTSPITYKIYTQGRWQQETIAANGGSYFHWQWPARQFRVSYNGVQYNIRFTSFRQAADPVKSQGKKYEFYRGSDGKVRLGSYGSSRTVKPPPPKQPPKIYQNPPQWKQAYELGIRRYRDKNMPQARSYLQQALTLSPPHDQIQAIKKWLAAVLVSEGRRFETSGNYAAAIEAYQQLHSLNVYSSAYTQGIIMGAQLNLNLQNKRAEAARKAREEAAARLAQEEADRVAQEEADRLAREKVSEKIANLLTELNRLPEDDSPPFDIEDNGLGFDSLPADLGPEGTLDGEPLSFSDFNVRSKSGADAIAAARRLNLQHPPQGDLNDSPPDDNSDHALPNPLDEDRIQRERMLIEPLNMVAFSALDETAATRFANARVEANRNEATRLARTELEETWDKLRQEGELGADEDPWKKSQTDKAFKVKFDAAIQEAVANEKQRMKEADQEWYHDMGRWVVWNLKKPELEPLIHEVTTRLNTERKAANDIHRNRFDFDCYNIETNLRNEGVLGRDESASARASRDPAFADRWQAETATAHNRLHDARMRVEENHKKKWAAEVRRIEDAARIGH